MTDHRHLRVALTLTVNPPHPFTAHDAGRPEVLATQAQWVRVIDKYGDRAYVVVFSDCGGDRSYWPDEILDEVSA